jgi:hypothetical protein
MLNRSRSMVDTLSESCLGVILAYIAWGIVIVLI